MVRLSLAINMQEQDDRQLIANYMKGDAESLEALVRRYLKPVHRFARGYVRDSHTAEDVAQETFVKMWRNIKKYDSRQSFKAWLFTIAKHTALDVLKKKKAIPFSQFENEVGDNMLTETLADASLSAYELSLRKDEARTLARAINTLSAKYRIVLSAYYHEHLNFREIAEQLGESINTVKSRHRRGLLILHKLLSAK